MFLDCAATEGKFSSSSYLAPSYVDNDIYYRFLSIWTREMCDSLIDSRRRLKVAEEMSVWRDKNSYK